ncbi:dehydrogenase [Prevotella sp. KH2C16]|nr:dehydrogenase [Prevotella sp. KH2C16]
MADNFLERHRDDYEARKAKWLLRKRSPYKTRRKLERPEDESL